MAKQLLPPPVSDNEAAFRSFLYADLALTVLMVFFRVYFLNYRIDDNPGMMNVLTMFFISVPGGMAILMAALIQYERSKSKRGG